jgi:uncharacterized protein YpbB
MAKLAFSKLNKIKSIPDVVETIDGNELVIKQYLSLEDKIELIINVLELAGSDEGFFNHVKLNAFYIIEMIKAYTNISFTEKQLENPAKLYDAIVMNGIWTMIESYIPENERIYIETELFSMAKAITKYNNSLAGMLKTLTADYSALDTEAIDIQKKLNTPEMVELLKRFLPEAGLTN